MNTFDEIDDIIAILNQDRRPNPSNSSSISTSSSEMFLDDSDSDLIELLNESKTSSSSSSYYSTGPLDTLTSYRSVENPCSSRRTSARQSFVSTSSKLTNETEEEIMNLLNRQHNLVNQLNHENIRLINENKSLKSQVKSKDSQLKNIQDSYASLLEQNNSLKEQLGISQVYNVAYLKQIKLSNKEISTMSIQHLIKSKSTSRH